MAILFVSATTVTEAAEGVFTPTGDMRASRQQHTETLLPDGTVLIVGGCGSELRDPGGCQALNTAERYNPVLGTFSDTGSMANARHGHTATLLANGTVLVAGGASTDFSSAEIYNPASGTFSPTGSMVSRERARALRSLLP